MDSVQLRRYALVPLLAAAGILAVSGLAAPHRYARLGSLVIAAETVLLGAGVAVVERYRPHLRALVEEKSYRITFRSVLATTFLTGVALLTALYLSAAVVEAVIAAWGYEPVSFQLFTDIVTRLQLLLELPLPVVTAGYAGSVAAMAAGFWILFPYLPVTDEAAGGPAAFAITWSYLLAAAAIMGVVPAAAPRALVFDAAVAAVWGHVFAAAYKDVERYVP